MAPLPTATTDGAASGGLPVLALRHRRGGRRHVPRPRPGRVGGGRRGRGAAPRARRCRLRPGARAAAAARLDVSNDWRIAPKTCRRASSAADRLRRRGDGARSGTYRSSSAWLPLLSGAPSGLPDLSRTGYAWTLWDAIVRYDATAGATVQAYGTFRYSADPRVVAPDAENPENAAYVITWIPTLEAVPPFAIRLDVVGGGKE